MCSQNHRKVMMAHRCRSANAAFKKYLSMQLSRSVVNVLKQGKNFEKLVDHEKSLKDETDFVT